MRSPRATAKALVLCALVLASTSVVLAGTSLWTHLDAGPRVLVNQVGYLPGMEKVFVIQAADGSSITGATFDVVDAGGNRVLDSREVMPASELWGFHHGTGDFTDIVAPGTYRVRVHARGKTHQSHPFLIGNDVYDLVLERAVQFFYYQRCGTRVNEIVPGYVGHEPCHLDDGRWMDENGVEHWKDLTGGWHDAGDYNKYTEDTYNTQYAVYHLARTYELLGSKFDAMDSLYDTLAPDIVDEATWGARFLQKMVVNDTTGSARVLCGLFGWRNGEFNRFGYWGEPASETDNIPSTPDDRMAGSLWIVSGEASVQERDVSTSYVNAEDVFMVVAALAKTAWIQRAFPHWDDDAAGPAGLVATATALYRSHEAFLFNVNGSLNETRTWWRSWPVLAGLDELARWANETGNATAWSLYSARAATVRDHILDRYDPGFGPWWWDAGQMLLSLHDHDVAVHGAPRPDLIALLDEYGTRALLPSTNGTTNVFSHFTAREHFHDVGDVEYYFHYWGKTIGISLASASAVLAWNATGDPALLRAAERNVLHWIMGRNPLDICQVESLGTRNLPLYHHRYANIPGNPRGAVPGTVPNGIARPPPIEAVNWWHQPDVPWFDMTPPNPERGTLADFRSNEPYITDNAAFLAGLATYLALAT